jgi:ATP-dependent RNA helicase RhlE
MDRINSGFHEKNAKNQQVNDRDRWRKERAIKYKKPKTRGDKGANLRRK